MEREALKLALEALESSNKLINGTDTKFGLEGAMDGYYSGCFDVDGNNKLLNEAITAIKATLAQPAQEPDALTIAYQSGFYDGKQAALAGRGWNFCERCGKRTADLTVIHTCTPPQEGA
jgi:hypothetical protein